MDDQPETVPTWVLAEVGRLHLHALALERELAARPVPVPPVQEADDQ